jgi:hypothetical protein
VKKIDYYAVQHPWRMPKWLGATIGGIFGFIAIASGFAIVKLTASSKPPVAAVAGAIGSSAAPAAAPAPAVTAPVAAAAPKTVTPAPAVASADDTAAPVAKKHAKRHAAHKAAKAAVAKRAVKPTGALVASTKHSGKKIGEKDALDKLLGL